MPTFTFYIEGPNKEVQVTAETEKAAHRAAWESLTPEQQDAVACLDCIDETPE